jgi:glutamate dehydrogenase
VARLVLADNYQQTQALSRLEARSAISFDADVRYMRALEKQGLLNRPVENLPDDEQLAVRAAGGHGLTRPELAVLLAYGKLTAYERLVHSKLMPPGFDVELEHYFPKPLRQAHAKEIKTHALRREIVMTRLVNEMVNRAGPTFLHEMEMRTGADIDAIVVAFLRATDAFSLRDVWRDVEKLDGQVGAAEQTRMMAVAESLLGRVVPRLLRPNIGDTVDPALDRAAVAALAGAVNDGSAEKGVPPLQRRLALFSRLTPALDLVPLARSTGADLAVLARLHVEVSQRFGLGWLAYSAAVGTFPTDWERRAADALVDETYDRAAELVWRIAEGGTSKGAVERFAALHARDVARLDLALTEAMALPTISLPLLTLISSEIRRLVLAARH